MSIVSATAAMLSVRYLYTETGQRVVLLLALSVFATAFFQMFLAGQLFWARFVPSSAAIIYTNVAAVFAAMGAGWGWRLPNTPKWRRTTIAIGLGMVSMAALAMAIPA